MYLNIKEIALAVLLSFALSVICSAIIARFGYKLSLVDKPSERSSHVLPTPRGGGIGIWLAFIIIGFFIIKNVLLTIGVGIIGLLGFLEDRFNFSSKIRLVIQLVLSIAAIIMASGLPFSVIEIFLFLFWIIFITGTANFYNFMDGINGIAGLTGIVGFGLLAYFSFFIVEEPDISIMCIALASACLGFLPFNFPYAKVFMGDVGSIFLGFVFAAFVVKLSTNISIFLCLIMFLCTFYADATVTIFYRWRRRENLMRAHRSHLYQYLSNELRLPHWQVAALFSVTQFIFGILALLSFNKGLTWQVSILGIFAIVFLISYKFLKNIRPLETN
jgi:Fuc2NAc and GlcNAc transferase